MEQTLFNFILQVPQAVAQFGNWITTPINSTYMNISPLGLLSVSGVAILTTIIGVHVVRLFVW